jgi:glyoxylase-like metal-dependent hydrolase (beta-lactamase superfamily II)
VQKQFESMPESLVYPFQPILDVGTTREIAEGVLWIRLPMPFALNHANVFALRDETSTNSWALVDTGLKTIETLSIWQKLLRDADGPLRGAKISRIFVTHMHADHIGLAGWMTAAFNTELWMPQLEYLTGRMLLSDSGRKTSGATARFYHAAGWTSDQLDSYRVDFGSLEALTYQMPDSYRRLHKNQSIQIGGREWRVLIGGGHSPEHACLYCPELKLFLSGDQVLPKISSNVSVLSTEPAANPLGDWLNAIETFKRDLPEDILVLPGHNEPFQGIHRRLDRLANGHSLGLERLLESLREPKRIVDTFGALFSRPTFQEPIQLRLATGESLAHINYLIDIGRVAIDRVDDGVVWYVQNV